MNKILLTLALLLSSVVGGYFLIPYLPQEQLTLLSKYLPTPVSSLLKINEKQQDERGSNASHNSSVNSDVSNDQQTATQSIDVQRESLTKQPINNAVAQVKAVSMEEPKPTALVVRNDNQSSLAKKMSSELSKKLDSGSPEVLKIKRRLEKVQKRISQFDNNNAALQSRFNKTIEENRQLSLKLKALNDQMKQANKQDR